MPPLSPGCLWVCSTLPFDESSPPVCSMLPRIVPPFCTSSVPVISLLVQTTSGVSRVTRVDAFTVTTGTVAVTESEAVTLAVLIPLIRRGCLEYDVSATDITSSFMAIRKTMTSSGRSATYEASRSEEASHADLAWATMHALLNEPLTAGISTPLTSTILEFY